MSPLATYMYKRGPKSRRGVETIAKYVQKHVVGKTPYRHLTRKGKNQRELQALAEEVPLLGYSLTGWGSETYWKRTRLWLNLQY